MFANPFSVSNPLECLETILYTVTDTDTNATPDPSIFTFSSGSIRVNNDNPANCKIYNLEIVATLNNFPSKTNTETFTIELIDSCEGVTITPTVWTD